MVGGVEHGGWLSSWPVYTRSGACCLRRAGRSTCYTGCRSSPSAANCVWEAGPSTCGVLDALHATAAGRYPEYEKWFAQRARGSPGWHRAGVLARVTTPARLIKGIRKIARGEPALDSKIAGTALTAANSPLTDREREVLRRAAECVPAKEIATESFLSVGTVRNYLSRSITKAGARTWIEAIRIAQNAGWI
jgi:DNA-binding CsgD family transcriptional regulator